MTNAPAWHSWSVRRRLKVKTRTRHRRRFWDRRDKRTYECPSCGCSYEDAGREWEVHHKDGDALNGHIFNLVALCHTCHRVTHSTMATVAELNEWKEQFLALGDGGGGEEIIATSGSSEMTQTDLTDFGGGVSA